MEREMQPADGGPSPPKMCSWGPCSSLKSFQSKRSAGKSRFDRPSPTDAPLFGDSHRFTFHQDHQQQQHQYQQYQYHPHRPARLQPLHQAGGATTCSSSSRRFSACEARPSSSSSSSIPTSSSASLRLQTRRPPGAEPRSSPDCSSWISSENRVILDAFALQCSRVLSLLNNGRLLQPPASSFSYNIKREERPGDTRSVCSSSLPLKSKCEESSSTTDPEEEEAPQKRLNSAVLHIFTDSLQNYLLSGRHPPLHHLHHRQQQQQGEEEHCPSLQPGSGLSPPPHNLGRWGSPAPSESYGHPSSTLPEEEEEQEEEEEEEEESCCPRCLELEQEVLSLQQENEELRNKLETIPVPCQNVLDYFKAVLEVHNQLVQPMGDELLTEEEERQTVFEGSKQLLENYPLFISNKQWDEAVNSSKKDGRRLLRYLIRYVFSTDELKFSCGLGKRKRSVHSTEPGLERRPLNPVKVSCLREFIRMHCASNSDWWMPSEEQINKVFSDAVGHARQGRAVGTFLGSSTSSTSSLYMDGLDGQLSQEDVYFKSCHNGQSD